MSGRILIVDDVATNRIVLKVMLRSACYAVEQADTGAAALRKARERHPDLILLDVMLPDISGLDVCRQLKADPETADIPVILVTASKDRDSRVQGLEAGADDYLTKPVDDGTLLARVRSSLRARDTARDLNDRGAIAPSFAEAAAPYRQSPLDGHVALIADSKKRAMLWKADLQPKLDGRITLLPRDTALTRFGTRKSDTVPDVFVIAADLTHRNEGLRLLSELRSRFATRHAASIVVLPDGDTDRAAIALDLGAADILFQPLDGTELAIRIRTQLDRKRQADALRACIQTGLELAAKDSLTGLSNRRQGLWRLSQMLQKPGRGTAVMMLDIDHFKMVNDRFGHAAGDRVLQLAARRLRMQIGPNDVIARIGGEEFLVALRDTDPDTALACAERLRRAVSNSPFRLHGPDTNLSITLSVGLAYVDRHAPLESAEDVLARADDALYGSKADGRDQVTAATPSAALTSAHPVPLRTTARRLGGGR